MRPGQGERRRSGRRAQRSAPIPILRCLGYGAVYLLLTQVGIALSFPPTGLGVFWPASAVAVVGAATLPARQVRLFLALVALVNAASNTVHGRPPGLIVWLAAANLVEALVAGTLLRRWVPGGRMEGPAEYLRLTAAVVLGVTAGGLVGTALFWPDRGAAFQLAWTWVVSDGLGALVLAPALLHHPSGAGSPAAVTDHRSRRLLVLLAEVALVTLVFATVRSPVAYVALAVVAAASVALPTRWASAGLAACATVAVWTSAHGFGPFSVPAWTPAQRVLAVAGFVLVTTLVSVTLSQALAARRHVSDLLQAILAVAPVAIGRWSPDGTASLTNPAWRALTGRGDGPARDWLGRVHPDDVATVLGAVADVDRGTRVDGCEFRMTSPEGEVWVAASAVRGPDGMAVVTLADITARRRAVELEALTQVLAVAPTPTLLLQSAAAGAPGRDGDPGAGPVVRQVNYAAEDLLGAPASALLGHRLADVLTVTGQAERAAVLDLAGGTVPEAGLVVQVAPLTDGSPRWVQVTGAQVHRDVVDGDERWSVLQLTDVSLRMAAEAELLHLSLHDPLTALPNRRLLTDRLDHALAASARRGCAVAVLFIDLDHFKGVNDSLGHAVGDAVLHETARRLSAALRVSDTVARMGGDEFAVVAELAEPDDPHGQVAVIVDRVRGALAAPVHVGGREVTVTASIGYVLSDPAAVDRQRTDPADLLRASDLAMYEAKGAGRDRAMGYDVSLSHRAERAADTRTLVQRALAEDWFTVHYQPLRGRDGEIVGLEGLVRIDHPERGLVLPSEFLGIAESTGLIEPIGAWVLRRVMADHAWVRERLGPGVRMFYNLSSRQQGGEDLVGLVVRSAAETGFDVRDLVVEITESAAIEEDLGRALTELHDLGVTLALDDFGTGYSALSYLRRLPLAILKVDRAFISGTPSGRPDRDIVSALIGLSRGLGLSVVSEGIETADQLAQTWQLGSDMFQGFHLNRPVPLEQLQTLGATT